MIQGILFGFQMMGTILAAMLSISATICLLIFLKDWFSHSTIKLRITVLEEWNFELKKKDEELQSKIKVLETRLNELILINLSDIKSLDQKVSDFHNRILRLEEINKKRAKNG